MKRKEIIPFLEKLLQRVRLDPDFPPDEIHVFNVHAAYGHYQVVIGPAGKVMAAEKNRMRGKHPHRPLEINGVMHHLFVTKNNVTPHPSNRQVHNNLKGCIVMRDLTIHIKDPTGSGRKLVGTNKQNAIAAKEEINLAGSEGHRLLNRMVHTGKLAKDTYKIVQEDILNALVNKQYARE